MHSLCLPAPLWAEMTSMQCLPSPWSCPHKQGQPHVGSGCLLCMLLQRIPHKVSICMQAAACQSPAQRPPLAPPSLPSSRKQIWNHALCCTTATRGKSSLHTGQHQVATWVPAINSGITRCHVLLKHFSVLSLRSFPHFSSFSAAYNPWLHFGRK